MDTLTPAQRSERMARVRGARTRPELCVRRLVAAIGVRYRLNVAKLPGRPDLIVPRQCLVIFVHGCFWHRHCAKQCKLARLPKSRLDFWLPKLEGNRLRDARAARKLRTLGWRVVTVWECQLADEAAVLNRLSRYLRGN